MTFFYIYVHKKKFSSPVCVLCMIKVSGLVWLRLSFHYNQYCHNTKTKYYNNKQNTTTIIPYYNLCYHHAQTFAKCVCVPFWIFFNSYFSVNFTVTIFFCNPYLWPYTDFCELWQHFCSKKTKKLCLCCEDGSSSPLSF